MSTLDSAWVMTAGYDGLAAHNSPAWMSLYLAVCKLLDLALVLPAHVLPQFQMYRWAFVREGEPGSVESDITQVINNNGPVHTDFVPHIARISRLMQTKVSLALVTS